MYQEADRNQEQCGSHHDLSCIHSGISGFVLSWVGDTPVFPVSPDLNVLCNGTYIGPMMRVSELNFRVTYISRSVVIRTRSGGSG